MAGTLAPAGLVSGAATGELEEGRSVGEAEVGMGVAAEGLGSAVPSSGGTSAVKALTTLRMPKPHLLSRPGAPISVAVEVNR